MAIRTGKTSVDRWHVSKLTAAFKDTYEGKTKLVMPPFQRGVVWSPAKQRELIKSLKSGYPVGSLLFYKRTASSNGIEENLLIDGLQRTTAIRDYQNQPLSFMELRDLDAARLEALEEAYRAAAHDREISGNFAEAVASWMVATKTLEPKKGFDSIGLLKALNNELSPDDPIPNEDDLVDALRDFVDSIKEECDIDKIEVPVLFYEGSEADLPNIFERINATGTKLSKYEIFAASWVNQDVEIRSEKVLEAIRKRYYTLMTKENISVNGVRADGTPERPSLFDYLFGLGKLLADEYPLLFGASDDPTAMESVAFALATVCYKLPLSQMHRLPTVMDRQKKIRPDDFESALLDSAQFVSDAIAPFIGIKLNSESASSALAHTDLQIASMVARAFCGKYITGTWETREGAEDDWKTLKRMLPQHYLIDVLQQNWRGSGDSRLFQMVWDSEEDNESKMRNFTPAKHYLREFTTEEFNRVLEQWFSDQIKLNQRSRAYVTSPVRVFLKFVYSDIVTVNAEKKESFELDHIFPVSRLASLAKSDDDGWPISAVANLALFDWRTNREKSKLDIVQYLEKVDPTEREKKRKMIEKYLFLSVESASIPTSFNGQDTLTRDNYQEFLKHRFNKMKDIVFDAVGIPKTTHT